jgi:hypothetical protein
MGKREGLARVKRGGFGPDKPGGPDFNLTTKNTNHTKEKGPRNTKPKTAAENHE